MFSQVVLAEKDRKYHRLLWRDLDPTKPVDVYEAVRLTFGDRASPYLAQFVLRSHALESKESYPEAAMVLPRDTYMDNILHSEETVQDAVLIREDLTKVLGGAGFRAQKWCSNRTEVLEEILQEDRATGVKLEDSELPSVKTLGVHWNASDDVFTFIVKEINLSFYTKRGLLSHIATPGGDERPSHNPLFRTILSKWVAHVTIHFDRVSECSVRPFDEFSVIYLHCIDLSTEKFTPVTSFACMEICCVLGQFSSPSDLAVRRLCCFLWSK